MKDKCNVVFDLCMSISSLVQYQGGGWATVVGEARKTEIDEQLVLPRSNNRKRPSSASLCLSRIQLTSRVYLALSDMLFYSWLFQQTSIPEWIIEITLYAYQREHIILMRLSNDKFRFAFFYQSILPSHFDTKNTNVINNFKLPCLFDF